MHPRGEISEPSRRVAKNTLLLYFRMLLMMTIGLFTSRVIYKSLGIEDLGVYNAVAGVVMMFTVVTSSVSQAISRFIAYELGRGNRDKLSKVFSNSLFIQLILSAILVVFVESFALWFLNHKMLIPEASPVFNAHYGHTIIFDSLQRYHNSPRKDESICIYKRA